MRVRIHYISIAVIIFAGFAIRLLYLNRSMRFDEALTFISYAKSPFPSVLANYSEPNNHIFHTFLVQIVYLAFGNHPMLIRLPAFVAGVLTIPVSYRVGRLFYNRHVGLLAAALVAASPPLVDFSVNARGYTLLTLITLLMLWLAHGLKRRNKTSHWLFLGILSALGFYTLPTMLYPMGIIAFWLLLSIIFQTAGRHRSQLLRNYVVSMVLGAVLTLILYTPVILFTGLSKLVSNPYVASLPASEFYGQLPVVWSGIYDFVTWQMPPVVVWLCDIGILVVIISHAKLTKDRISLLAMCVVWLLPVLLIQRVIPYDRVWIFLIPIYSVLAAAGLVYLLRFVINWIPSWENPFSAVVVVLCAGLAVQLQQSNAIHDSLRTGRADDSEAAAFYFEENIKQGDSLYFSYPTNWTVFYYADLHHLTFLERESTDTPQTATDTIYVYYHWEDEKIRLLDAMKDVLTDPNVTYRVVHTFPASTLEQVFPAD